MSKLDKVSSPNNLANVLPLYISCLGCSASPVDFIPEKYSKAKKKESKKKKESVSSGVTILLVGILGAAALSAFSYFNHQTALEEKQNIEEQIADIEYAETVYRNAASYDQYKADLSVLEEAIKSPNDGLRQFIDELEKKMPAEVNILSVRCTKENISMNITVTTKVAAAKTIQQLRSFESIRDIVVGQMSETTDESGNISVSFSVECGYDYEPYVLPAPDKDPQPQPEDAGAQASGDVG
jgi:type IV pilus assembly protein PilM